MNLRHASLVMLASLGISACSSSSDDATAGGGGSGGASDVDASADVSADVGDDAAPCTDEAVAKASRASCAFAAGDLAEKTLGCAARTRSNLPIEHVIVLMQENRSFDHYLGRLKGHGQDDVDVPADGASNPATDGGTVPWHHLGTDEYCFSDTNHEWEGVHEQIGGGAMDGFVKTNEPGGERAMGYFDQSDLPFYYDLASKFAISDRYFCDVPGPTYPNRLFLMAGTSFGLSANKTAPAGSKGIFHALTAAGISWKVYKSDVPAAAILDVLLAIDAATKNNFASIEQFAVDAQADALPSVVFLDPSFSKHAWIETDEHPPADVQVGESFVHDQVVALMGSPSWKSSAMFITYDEHGGQFDHVAPPKACKPDDAAPSSHPELGGFDEYGIRVPIFVVSPYAKAHFVSHETHSHASILRFIETRFGLPALTGRDANSDAMLDFFDFANPPFLTPPTLVDAPVDATALTTCQTNFPK